MNSFIKLSIFIFTTVLYSSTSYSQSIIGKLILIKDGDTITDYSNIKLLGLKDNRLVKLSDNNGNIIQIEKKEDLKKIILIFSKDTLSFFDLNESEKLPYPLNQVAKMNYKCFFEKHRIWQIYVDNYPFEWESVVALDKKNNKNKYFSVWIKGCVEGLESVPSSN